jgi:hypothetical protein
VLARFKQLFPKTKLGITPHPVQRRNISVIHGITFNLGESILNKGECIAISDFATPVAIAINPYTAGVQTSYSNFSNSREENQKNDVLLPSTSEPFSDPAPKSSEIGVAALHSCPVSITGVQTGIATGDQDTLIATHSTLLRMESPDDVVCQLNPHVQGIIENIREFILFNADLGTFQ